MIYAVSFLCVVFFITTVIGELSKRAVERMYIDLLLKDLSTIDLLKKTLEETTRRLGDEMSQRLALLSFNNKNSIWIYGDVGGKHLDAPENFVELIDVNERRY